jgi:hypothetical protein
MKPSSILCSLAFVALAVAAVAGCGAGSSTPSAMPAQQFSLPRNYPATPTPAPRLLYAVHSGVVSVYSLPLKANAKPLRVLDVTPGHPTTTEAVTVDAFGKFAIVTPKQLRIYLPPITSLAPSKARLTIPLTPAMTAIGPAGADVVDVEFDPYDNLWLLSDLNSTGADITELPTPISRMSVSPLNIQFGVAGTKTSGFQSVVQGRFDVNSSLYVYANNSNIGGQLFKIGFPYGKPPSSYYGLNLLQAAFVDASQFLYGPPAGMGNGAIFGQYFGQLYGTPPLQPTPPPVNVLAQFNEPLMPDGRGMLFPNVTVKANVGALAADPPRDLVYTLDVADGKLNVYPMPLPRSGKPNFSLPCSGGPSICNSQLEHLFTAP